MNKVISISFPKELIERSNKYIPPQKRSKAIVKAFNIYLELMKRKQIENEMTNMYENMTEQEKKEMYELSEASPLDDFSKYL